MQGTGTFLHHAALATLVAIPLAAVAAVLLGPEGWCSGCDAAAAAAPPAYDHVQEDDGEP